MPVMKLLAAALACLWAGGAFAVEMQRNGVSYDLRIALPAGAKLGRAGNDRKFTLNGVEGIFRLAQDDYETCLKLVEERKASRRRDGYREVNREIADKECSIGMMDGSGRRISSFYAWIEACKCFAAVHFAYDSDDRSKFLSMYKPILASLRASGASAAAPVAEPTAPVAASPMPSPQQNPNSLKMTFRNQDSHDLLLNVRTRARTHAWPAAASSWPIAAGKSHTVAIACRQGDSICFGAGRAEPDDADKGAYWGRGVDGSHGCENCCYLCGGGDVAVNLLPGQPAGPDAQPSRDAVAASDPGIGAAPKTGAQ